MEPALALLTCGPQLEVALATGRGGPASVVRLAGVAPRSTLVLAGVDLLLEDAGLRPTDLGLVAVSRGPGSFTGVRAGLATADGIAAGVEGLQRWAYSSLLVQAARVDAAPEVWTAQPGRRGEVYAQAFTVTTHGVPQAGSEIEVVTVADAAGRGPWLAAEALDLGEATRLTPARTGAEALLRLVAAGAEPETAAPLYVEGPPVSAAVRRP